MKKTDDHCRQQDGYTGAYEALKTLKKKWKKSKYSRFRRRRAGLDALLS